MDNTKIIESIEAVLKQYHSNKSRDILGKMEADEALAHIFRYICYNYIEGLITKTSDQAERIDELEEELGDYK